MNLGEALQRPMADPDWIKKCALIGLTTFIPIVGPFTVIGWSIRYYEGLRQGDTQLPEPFADLGGDIVRGLKFAVAMFLFVLPLALVAVCSGLIPVVIAQISQDLAPIGAILTLLVVLPVSLIFAVLVPAAEVAYLETGSIVVYGQLGPVVARIRQAPMAYVMLFVGIVIAQFIGQIGAIACFVGIILTMPVGQAMRMSMVRSWEDDQG